MRFFAHASLLALALAAVLSQPLAFAQNDNSGNLQPQSEQLFALANQARSEAGAARLQWDPALAAAALQHCQRMAAEVQIAHRYGGEADLTTRTAQAGAHFSLIEENVAVGPTAAGIHDEWMHSPGHRTNLLNPEVDRVGIAVVSSRGVLYAVADYARAVQLLSQSQIEAKIAGLIRAGNLSILADPSLARAACAIDQGLPHSSGGPQPRFVMRWQDADLTHLPQPLIDHLSSGKYHQASVGSCPAQTSEGAFTAYRLAVLLY